MGGAVSVAKKIFDPDSNNKPDKKMFVTYLNQVTVAHYVAFMRFAK